MIRRPWWKHKRVWLPTAAVAVYLLCGFLLLPWVAERQIAGFAGEQLALETRIVDADFNPLTFRFDLEGADFRDGQRKVLEVDRLTINFDPIASLFSWAWSFGAIELEGPYLYVHAAKDGRFNWQDIMARLPEPQSEDIEENADLPRMQLARLHIGGGVVDYVEERSAGVYRHEFSPIEFTLTEFATLPEGAGPYRLEAVTESGATIRWSGRLQAAPVQVGGSVALADLPLAEIDEYLGALLPVSISEGSLFLETDYRVATKPDLGLSLTNGQLRVERPVVVERGPAEDRRQRLLELRQLSIDGVDVRWPGEPQVQVTTIQVQAPRIRVTREADGRLNWERLFAATESSAGADDDTGAGLPVGIAAFRVVDGEIDWTDQAWQPKAEIAVRDVSVEVRSMAWPPAGSWPLTLSATIGDSGTLDLEGTLSPDRQEINSGVEIRNLSLAAGNDYLAGLARASWSSGELSLTADIQAGAGPPSANVQGTLQITDAELLDDAEERVAAWRGLAIDTLAFQWPQARIEAADINLDSPYLRLRVAAGYDTNIQQLVIDREPAGAVPVGAAPGDPWAFSVGPTTIQAAAMDFRDENVPGGFSATIHDLGGSIGRLDSSGSTPAGLDLAGKANEQAELSIEGRIEPFAVPPMTDVTMAFRNLALVPLSPYTVKFAGYRVDQGKLRLSLHYRVENQQLTGSNHAVLDQFALGQKVPSESAISAPIELAVALLKDDQGVIDLDIPVSGDLSNPEFSLGGVIGKAIASAIGRIVTAPFRLLAGLVGGDEQDLREVAFEAGNDTLATGESENMERLASALQQRPQLRLEIRPGWATPDRRALRRQKLDARITEAGGSPGDLLGSRAVLELLFLEDFSESELETVVAEHSQSDPETGQLQLDESGYVSALDGRLFAGTRVEDEVLTTLAIRRAERVSSRLQELGVDSERLFILDARQIESDPSDVVALPLSVRG